MNLGEPQGESFAVLETSKYSKWGAKNPLRPW